MTLSEILKNIKYRNTFFIILIIVSFLYLFFKNFKGIVSVWDVSIFTFTEKLKFSLKTLFSTSEINTFLMWILVILFVLSISLFFLLIYALFKETKKLQTGKSFWGLFWIFISALGLSCAGCGISILVSFLSFLGLSSLISFFPMHGMEFSFLGIIALNISNFFLLKKLKNPYTCKS